MNESPRVLLHTSYQTLRWGDMDAYGHVNNANYFRYMEQSRVEWIEAMGYVVGPVGEGPVIITAGCTFLAPLTYPAEIEIKLFAGPAGRSSVMTYYEIRCRGEERLYATGESKVVWMNTESGKSIPLPEGLRARLPAA